METTKSKLKPWELTFEAFVEEYHPSIYIALKGDKDYVEKQLKDTWELQHLDENGNVREYCEDE